MIGATGRHVSTDTNGEIGLHFDLEVQVVGIFLAAAVAVLIWVVLNKTAFGYELKAVGLNRSAARYAGINEKKNIILSMAIAGALAGFGAGLYLSLIHI